MNCDCDMMIVKSMFGPVWGRTMMAFPAFSDHFPKIGKSNLAYLFQWSQTFANLCPSSASATSRYEICLVCFVAACLVEQSTLRGGHHWCRPNWKGCCKDLQHGNHGLKVIIQCYYMLLSLSNQGSTETHQK